MRDDTRDIENYELGGGVGVVLEFQMELAVEFRSFG